VSVEATQVRLWFEGGRMKVEVKGDSTLALAMLGQAQVRVQRELVDAAARQTGIITAEADAAQALGNLQRFRP
jgi:hypothetical protein